MSCDQYIHRISAALDGELTAEERRALDDHLAVCPHCMALFQTLSEQSRALRDLDCSFPSDLHTRILNSLPEQQAPAKRGKVIHWKRWSSLAACLVLVALAALSVPRFSARGGESFAPAAPGSAAYGGSTGSLTADQSLEYHYNLPDAQPESPKGYGYSKIQYLRVNYGSTPAADSAQVISSPRSLANYLSGFDSGMYDETDQPIPNPQMEALREFYTEDFFADRCLLAIVLEEPSGSISHEIQSVTCDSVAIRRTVPEVGTCDMAAWLILVELDEMLDDGSALSIQFIP